MTEPQVKSSVSVRIAGEEHTIRSNAAPEYTRACAEFVDERIRDIRKRSSLVETHKAAILAALSITDQYFQARDESARTGGELDARAGALADRVEAALSE